MKNHTSSAFMNLGGNKNMSLLEVNNLGHSFGDKILYKEASFELFKGEHMGVIGQNGAGKSTLIKILSGEVLPDKGNIKWQPRIKIGKLDQYAEVKEEITIFDYLRTAFKELFIVEARLNALYLEMAENCTDEILKKVSTFQEILDKNNFYGINSTIEKVAAGLGVKALGLENTLNSLSGGQRAKVILSKLLLENPEILILDEPTNFLDKEHVEWLSTYLKGYQGAFIIVSHSYEFLDAITTCICDIEFNSIKKYKGNYSACLKQKTASREEYVREYNSQQKEIKKIEEFIAKHIVRATSASMAKDRQKKLARMDKLEDPPKEGVKPNIHFSYANCTYQVILEVEELQVGYYYPLLPKMNFYIENGEKIVITGFNGIGKSTLLKTLIGVIPKMGGNYKFADKIKIGYYEQELVWENPEKTPIQIIKEYYPDLSEKEIRKKLAQAGLRPKNAMQEISTLSGGEQAKVNLCRLMLMSCGLLILDEPSNHLDELTKQGLQEALMEFKGTVIIVSHEESFYKKWATRIVNINDLCARI